MRTSGLVLLSCTLLLSLTFSDLSAQSILHELASPYPQGMGCFGGALALAGDLDGDGCDDIVVGASRTSSFGPAGEGRAYVVSGATGDTLYSLESPNDPDGFFGNAVAAIGDLDDDGFDDVVIGAWREDIVFEDEGAVYFFSGHTGTHLRTLTSPMPETGGLFGTGVAGIGDVNADGYSDIVVGSAAEDGGATDSGRAYIFSGVTGEPLDTLASSYPATPGWFGAMLSGAGDVDDDGCPDVVVGAPAEDHVADQAGRVYAFSGATGDTLYTFVSPNPVYQGWVGIAVAGAGDVNDDGFSDVIVGSDDWLASSFEGRAYIIDGPSGSKIHELISPNNQWHGLFGRSVAGLGDVNNDGYGDVIVGAPWENPGASPTDAGRAYVFSGDTGDLLCTLTSPNEEYDGQFGTSATGAGNIDNDGFADLVVGSPYEDPGALPDSAGMAYVFSLCMDLAGSMSGGELVLDWEAWSGPVDQYWVYGADNQAHFSPGFAPGYEHRVAVLPPVFTTWSSSNGVGEPDHNWSYLVIAVDIFEQELGRSNCTGEYDFSASIP